MNRRSVAAVLALTCVVAFAASLRAAGARDRGRPENVTVVGKLVDLQSYMTGKAAKEDSKKIVQQCIRSGVPAVLETEEGLIVIGMGERGPARLLVPLALETVELQGKLYEKEGLHYIDITAARAVQEEAEEAEHAEHADPAEVEASETVEEEEPQAVEEEPNEEEP